MEQKKPINGCEWCSISIDGIVKNEKTGNVLTQLVSNTGYKYVQIRKNGKNNHKAVHRLVAEAFIPNPENKPCVNHIDGNKLNNDISNLEWCTYSENIGHAAKVLGKMGQYQKCNIPRRKRVRGTDVLTGNETVYESIYAASLATKIPAPSIAHVLRGRQKKTHGYKWEYFEERKQYGT